MASFSGGAEEELDVARLRRAKEKCREHLEHRAGSLLNGESDIVFKCSGDRCSFRIARPVDQAFGGHNSSFLSPALPAHLSLAPGLHVKLHVQQGLRKGTYAARYLQDTKN
jgi:hypothetical protein